MILTSKSGEGKKSGNENGYERHVNVVVWGEFVQRSKWKSEWRRSQALVGKSENRPDETKGGM
jgi:hypothetical protein